MTMMMNGRLGLNCRPELYVKARGHRCTQYVSKNPAPITFVGIVGQVFSHQIQTGGQAGSVGLVDGGISIQQAGLEV